MKYFQITNVDSVAVIDTEDKYVSHTKEFLKKNGYKLKEITLKEFDMLRDILDYSTEPIKENIVEL